MGLGNVPPVGPGRFGGVQGPGKIPPQAKDDANQMTLAYQQLARVYAQFLEETDPSKKEALEKKLEALLGQIKGLCNDLVSIKPPLPKDILSKADEIAGHVEGMLENIGQVTSLDIAELSLQIAGLNKLINP